MNEIAMWLGYGVMAVGGLLVVIAALITCSMVINSLIRAIGKFLQFYWDLKVLRATMRQLEAEGKVKRMRHIP